ncbi:hypothetical protein [Citricoccus sp. GCM10030269]|uniref:hypothetical protein n=1 Tax=Citricoccus sp. GCM10030269 TaxID=3273388 RepID=UPI00361B0600
MREPEIKKPVIKKTDPPLPTRRSLRQHRRADREAGAPEGETTVAAILELPANAISPTDVGPLTGQVPQVYSAEDATDGGYALKRTGAENSRVGSHAASGPASVSQGAHSAELPVIRARRARSASGTGGLPEHVTLDRDGVPVGPDGQPLSRREIREWRRQRDAESAVSAGAASAGAAPTESAETSPSQPTTEGTPRKATRARRAEAPAGGPAAVVPQDVIPGNDVSGTADEGTNPTDAEPVTRESLAAEAAELAEKIQASGGGDPSAVDPDLLRQQERLAEKARQLNTGLISQVPPAETVVQPRPKSPVAERSASEAPVVHEPVEAQAAHGLDSLKATEWSARERTLMIVAGIVVLILLIALILAIVF